MMAMRRNVVMVFRGGADYVLFDCGHTCVMDAARPFRSREYPSPRRMCFRCPREAPVPVDRAEFVRAHGDGSGTPTIVIPETEPA
jgi:hypothetical protein